MTIMFSLAEQDSEQLNKWGYVHHSPQDITKFYIQHLLEIYRNQYQINRHFQKIVITVPEIWVREGRHAARQKNLVLINVWGILFNRNTLTVLITILFVGY